MDLKNIYYIPAEKRYIGRKQINGQTITVHAKTQLECRDKLRERIKECTCLIVKPTKKRRITLKEYSEKWYKQDKEPFIAERTKEDILTVLKAFAPIENFSLTQLNKDVLSTFLSKMPRTRTKEKVVIYLKAIFKNAVANSVLKKNPFDLIVTDPRRHNPKEALTYQEQVKVMEELKKSNLRVPILIYLITGLRKNELNFKNIENDIDLETNTLKALNLKGRHNVVRYKRIRLTSAGLSLIMNNLDIIKQYNAETCYKQFFKFMQDLGIKKSIVNLRHTFATNHLYLGTPEFVISKEMGHSSSQITKDNYMNLDYHLSKEKILKLYNNLYPIFE